jgi:PAS domain S-box-containing protein
MSHLPLADPPHPDESPEALRDRVVALEARLAVLEPLLERFPGVIARFDRQLRHRFVSASVEGATGLPAERFLGKTNRDLGMPEELVDQWDAALANVFATGQPARIQFTFPAATGLQYYDAELVPEPGPDGTVATVIAVTRDVTERVRAEAAAAARAKLEEELRRHQVLLQGLFEHAPAIILVKDQAGHYLAANNRLATIVDRSVEDILGKTVHDLFPPEIAAKMEANDQQVFATGQPLLVEEQIHIGGTLHTQLAVLFPLFDAQGATSAMGLIATDITEQKQLEAALRAQEAALAGERAFLDAVLEHLDDGVAVSDVQGQLRFANAALARITGYQPGGAVAPSLVALLGVRQSEVPARGGEAGLQAEPPLQNELRVFVHEDGTRRELLLSQQWLLRDGTPLLVSSFRDVTAQRAAEAAQHRTEQKLQEAQRLESLGRLAGGIAHDFNNLLAVILGHADLLSVDLAPDAPERANLSQIAGAARQGADLARQMLTYAGRGRLMLERVDLNEVLRNDRLLLEASLRTDARLQLMLAPELPLLMVDLDQIRQVVMNLVANASEALGEGGGVITIGTELVTRREGERHDDDLPAGAYVQLKVHDTGEGIDPTLLERVFEPFFSTRFIGRGLGLAVVRSIVERHGGRVYANSEPKLGTRVTVVLPVLAATTEGPAATSPSSRRGGMVLVVDDEARVQQVAGSMLTRLGYTPVLVQDGSKALAEIQARGDELALVLLDLTMPGMHGKEVLKAIRAAAPDLPVVVMSGYSTREVARELINQGASGFLEKPFSLSALRAQLRALDAGRRSG